MNNNLTEIIFIMDRSGSMASIADDTIGGFNSLIEKQRAEEGECRVTTVLFNDRHKKLHDCVDIKEISPMTYSQFCPLGATALLDAVGDTINEVGARLVATPEKQRPGKIIMVITTDGYENASKEFTQEQVKKMIDLQQNTYNWSFMFLGANIDAEQVGMSYGIRKGYSKTYTATGLGTQSVYNAVDSSLSCLRSRGISQEDIDKAIVDNLSAVE